MEGDRITVFLADDNTLVREGVKALLSIEKDIEVVGTAEDYDGLVEGATAAHPQVVVSDIRMPPNFQDEGIAGAKEVRKRHPGDGDRGAVAPRVRPEAGDAEREQQRVVGMRPADLG